jgi:hypothetical protein
MAATASVYETGHFWGVLHHVVNVSPSVLEENTATIFRATDLVLVDTEIIVARN